MSDIVFFVKLFCLTVALVLVMQIQVGDASLETHAMSWIQSSLLVAPLNKVARGGAKMVRDLSLAVHSSIDKNTGKKKKEVPQAKVSSFHWFHHSKPEQSASSAGD
jgi:hypothetical protein